LRALSDYKYLVKKALTEETDRPRIPNYIGECFLKIAQHLSYRPNFINYPFREDMISDGIENCVQYIDNFDPNRGNPFAYFTQIIYYAFIRRITKEKKQQSIKEKMLKETNIEHRISVQAHDDERDYQQAFMDMLDKYTFNNDN